MRFLGILNEGGIFQTVIQAQKMDQATLTDTSIRLEVQSLIVQNEHMKSAQPIGSYLQPPIS